MVKKQKMNRRFFLKKTAAGLTGLALSSSIYGMAGPAPQKKKNFLIITADDMSFETPGCYGNKTPDITPHIDELSTRGVRMRNGFVTVAICQPSRSSWITGRLPQHNGTTGFNPIAPSVPRLGKIMKDSGYYTGIVMKVDHYAPATSEDWDYINGNLKYKGRDPGAYGPMLEEFFAKAEQAGKPFFLIVNITDPHRPYAGSEFEKRATKGNVPPGPSRCYTAEDIQVPGFLPDTPGMRDELKDYYNSAKRCDDSVGELVKVFDKSGHNKDTIVMYLSDHGAPLPFAKSGVYRQSIQTPWIIIWPGVTRPGSEDSEHYVNGYDFMPTILDMAGLPGPEYMDGKSFAPALRGEEVEGFDTGYGIFIRGHCNVYNQRSIHEKKWTYIYNEWSYWSYGDLDYIGDNMIPALYPASETDEKVAQRVEFYLNRCPEELYDYENDPWSLVNLASVPEYYAQLKIMRQKMLKRLTDTHDPARNSFNFFIDRTKKMQPVDGRNLVANPGFDDGASRWQGSGMPPEIVTDEETGNKFARIVDLSKENGDNCHWISEKIPIKPGAFYEARFTVNVNCADNAIAFLRFFDDKGNMLGQGRSNLPMRCFAPRKVEISPFKAPQNAAKMDFMTGTVARGCGVFWIDDIEVREVR